MDHTCCSDPELIHKGELKREDEKIVMEAFCQSCNMPVEAHYSLTDVHHLE